MAGITEGGDLQSPGYMGSAEQGTRGSDSGTHSRAGELAQAGKEKVKQLGGMGRQRLYSKADSRKGELVRGMHDLAETLEKTCEAVPSGPARSALNSALDVLNRTTDTIEQRSTQELVREAQSRIRERPGAFIAGCVALGFLAGRFVKDLSETD